MLVGVIAQFNMDAPSVDLINADYVIGFPISLPRLRHSSFRSVLIS